MNKWQVIDDFWGRWLEHIEKAGSTNWGAAPMDFAWIELTPIERALFEEMRNLNMVFYPQWPVAGVFVDFANPVAKIAIECDGKAFHRDQAKDAERDSRLADLGWIVYRLPGWACHAECDEEKELFSASQLVLREICARHPVQRVRRDSSPWFSFGAAMEAVGAAA
ncbi:MAG: DUF559 domain-containing protein [Comamonadaceae bacterium]|nr:MAG: DUF559 domain-containing protein [Comamonadaceae bacterium]